MTFSYSAILEKCWNDIKDQLPLVAGLSLVYFVGLSAISLIPFAGSFFSGPFTAGYLVCLIKIRQRQVIGYADVFWGFQDFNRFLQLLLLGFLVGLITVAGLICLIIPGIWFAVSACLATAYFVLDQSDAIASMKKSLAAVKGHWWKVFGLLFLCGLIAVAGALCFLVGLLIAMPLITLMLLNTAEVLGGMQKGPPSTGGPSVLTVNPSN